jgi:hypothetical protein
MNEPMQYPCSGQSSLYYSKLLDMGFGKILFAVRDFPVWFYLFASYVHQHDAVFESISLLQIQHGKCNPCSNFKVSILSGFPTILPNLHRG